MAGSSGGTLLKVGLAAGAAYVAYEYLLKPAMATPSAPSQPSAPSGSPTPATPPPSRVPYNSLDQIYARLAAAVGSTPYTADQFNYYLSAQLPAGKAPPDPAAVFGESFDRSKTMTLPNYWGAMAQYLKTSMGLSGLGVFGS